MREAGFGDLGGIYEVEVRSFERPYTREMLALLLSLAGRYALVAECGSGIVGYAVAVPYVDMVAHLASIAVLPECRGRGIGSKLLEMLEDRLREAGFYIIFLETWVSNRAARAFYEKRGYRPLLVLPRYYEWGEDAILYAKLLVGSVG